MIQSDVEGDQISREGEFLLALGAERGELAKRWLLRIFSVSFLPIGIQGPKGLLLSLEQSWSFSI